MDYAHSCYLPAAGALTSTYPGACNRRV
jgi:hypothetical protein